MLCLRGLRRLVPLIRVPACSPRLNSSTSYQGYEVTKEHLYDSEGNELPLLKFLRARQEATKGITYEKSPTVSCYRAEVWDLGYDLGFCNFVSVFVKVALVKRKVDQVLRVRILTCKLFCL